MAKRRFLSPLLYLACAMHVGAIAEDAPALSYLVLTETVPPLMIATGDDPMAGGIVTEVLIEVLQGTGYRVDPVVAPWQRMSEEMAERDNWIMYGMASQCEQARGCARSTEHIVDFRHAVVTLADSTVAIQRPEDLFGLNLLLVENYHYPGLDQYLTNPVRGDGSGAIREVRAHTPEGAIKMLRHRRGDAYIDWYLRILYNLDDAGLQPDEVLLADASHIVPQQNIHFFFSNRLPQNVRNHFDKRLAEMRRNGTLARIVERYR